MYNRTFFDKNEDKALILYLLNLDLFKNTDNLIKIIFLSDYSFYRNYNIRLFHYNFIKKIQTISSNKFYFDLIELKSVNLIQDDLKLSKKGIDFLIKLSPHILAKKSIFLKQMVNFYKNKKNSLEKDFLTLDEFKKYRIGEYIE